MSLPDNDEIKTGVFLKLDFATLSEKYADDPILQRDSFWREKVDHDFQLAHLKPPIESYYEQYLRLYYTEDPIEQAKHGWIDGLLLLSKRMILPKQEIVCTALKYNQPNLLDWLAARNVFPDRSCANKMLQEHNWDGIYWLAQRGIYPEYYPMD